MEENTNKNGKKPGRFGNNSYWIYAIIIFGILIFNVIIYSNKGNNETTTEEFFDMAERGYIEKVEVINKSLVQVYLNESGKKANPDLKENPMSKYTPDYTFELGSIETFTARINELNKEQVLVSPTYKTKQNYLLPLLSWLLPVFLIIGLWIFFMRRVGGGGGGGGAQIFNIGKSKASLFDANANVNVTFADVAGLDEAKEEVMEVVDFLQNPKKYTSLGGKIPKGVLLVGPPGTGKTLLAKAVAGEAGVPFFSISGSDFVEMFVGVGASRVRDLFKQAREKAPCIVFIDEIDAIGRARGRGQMQGGNDERENTLNQLLVEMDGFSTDKGVILMAATNRPDILDSALMRPGRFDRQIGIDRPDLNEREAIFNVHLKNIKVSDKDQHIMLCHSSWKLSSENKREK